MNVETVRKGLAEPYQRRLANSLFGNSDADSIAAFLRSVAREHLGWNYVDCFHFEISVGAVFGLSNGVERCILKAYTPDSDLKVLRSQSHFQQYLAESGYPCPSIVLPPTKDQDTIFGVETYLDDGRRANGHLLRDRELMAVLLAELVSLGEKYPNSEDLPTQLLESVHGSPWPKPHNVLFDFSVNGDGAAWIDDVGWRCKDTIEGCDQPLVIGHLDWGAKHFRILDERVSATYDWDSVVRCPEARIVGEAMTNFATTWYVECPNRPSVDEMLGFLKCYLSASDGQLDTEVLTASMFYAAGYSARCEHAIYDATGVTENCDFLKMLLDSNIHSGINALLR